MNYDCDLTNDPLSRRVDVREDTSGHLCVSGEERRKSILTAFIKHAFVEKERKSLTKNFPSPLSEKDFHSIFVFIRIETRSVVEAFFGSAKRRKEKSCENKTRKVSETASKHPRR